MVWAQSFQTNHQENLKNPSFEKISKAHSRIWQIVVKIKKKIFWLVLILLLLSAPYGIYLYDKFFWEFAICLTPFFEEYFGLISCIFFIKEIFTLKMVTMDVRKRHFLSYHNNYRTKSVIKTLNVIDLKDHWKNCLLGSMQVEKKYYSLKKINF